MNYKPEISGIHCLVILQRDWLDSPNLLLEALSQPPSAQSFKQLNCREMLKPYELPSRFRLWKEENRMNDKNFNLSACLDVDLNRLEPDEYIPNQNSSDLLLRRSNKKSETASGNHDIAVRNFPDEIIDLFPETNNDTANTDKPNPAVLKIQPDSNSSIDYNGLGLASKKYGLENMNGDFVKTQDGYNLQNLIEGINLENKAINSVLDVLFVKNKRLRQHSKRVSRICELIAIEINFSDTDTNQIRIAGLMHDIGKIGISKAILNKTCKLNQNEWNEIERHSQIGYNVLHTVDGFLNIADFILEHHERWDGKGYPRGISGDNIFLQARIIAVADAFDAMTSKRSYRKAVSKEAAITEIAANSGTQFDPDIAKVFVKIIKKGLV